MAKAPALQLTNPVLEAMRSGQAAMGLSVRLVRSPDVVRIAKVTNHHFLFIDGQHAIFNIETIVNIASTALALGVAPLVRVRSPNDSDVPMLLDNGVTGIIFPDVNTPAEAKRCVELCKFPPIGRRSVGAVFPQLNGQSYPLAETIPAINGSTVCCVMVETKRGLDNIEEIAKVPGVDVVHIGTNDLVTDLGKPGQLNDPMVDQSLDRAIAACKAAGNFAGCGGVRDPARQAAVIKRGIRFLTTQSDAALLQAGAKAWTDGVAAALGRQ